MADMLRLRDQTERLLAIERDPNTADTTVAKASGTSTRRTTGSSHPGAGSTPKRTCACSTRTTRSEPQPALHVGKDRAGRFRSQRRHALQEGRHTGALRCPNTCGNRRRDGHQLSTAMATWTSTSSAGCSAPGTTSKPSTGSAISSSPTRQRHTAAGGRIPVRRRGRQTRPRRRAVTRYGRSARTDTHPAMARRQRSSGQTPPASVEGCRRELVQTGAWQSATDPIHARKSVAEAPGSPTCSKEHGRGQRRAFRQHVPG